MLLSNIQKRVGAAGSNIAELERNVDFPKSTIGRWDKSTPSVDKVLKVAKALNCTVEDLLKEE